MVLFIEFFQKAVAAYRCRFMLFYFPVYIINNDSYIIIVWNDRMKSVYCEDKSARLAGMLDWFRKLEFSGLVLDIREIH